MGWPRPLRGAGGLQDTDTPYSTATDGDNSSNIITRQAEENRELVLFNFCKHVHVCESHG